MPQLVTNLLTRDVRRSAVFYHRLCGFDEVRSSDVFVVLASPDGSQQLALIDWVSELVPRAARGIAEGTYLTLVQDDIENALGVAAEFEVEIIEQTRSEDADGAIINAVIRDLDGRVIELTTPEAHLAIPPQKTVA